MTKIEADTADGSTIEPLVGEIAAAEAAARDGGLDEHTFTHRVEAGLPR